MCKQLYSTGMYVHTKNGCMRLEWMIVYISFTTLVNPLSTLSFVYTKYDVVVGYALRVGSDCYFWLINSFARASHSIHICCRCRRLLFNPRPIMTWQTFFSAAFQPRVSLFMFTLSNYVSFLLFSGMIRVFVRMEIWLIFWLGWYPRKNI